MRAPPQPALHVRGLPPFRQITGGAAQSPRVGVFSAGYSRPRGGCGSPSPGSTMKWPHGRGQARSRGSPSVWTKHHCSETAWGLRDSGQPAASQGKRFVEEKTRKQECGEPFRGGRLGRAEGRMRVCQPCTELEMTGEGRDQQVQGLQWERAGALGTGVDGQGPRAEWQAQDAPAAGQGPRTDQTSPRVMRESAFLGFVVF